MTPLRFVSIGMDHLAQANRIIAVFSPHTTTGKRYIAAAKKTGLFVDASVGRKTRSLILMDDGTVLFSAVSAPTLLNRLNSERAEQAAREEMEANEDH